MAAKSAPVKPRSNEKKAPAPAKERPAAKASPASEKPPEKAKGKPKEAAREEPAPEKAALSRPAAAKAAPEKAKGKPKEAAREEPAPEKAAPSRPAAAKAAPEKAKGKPKESAKEAAAPSEKAAPSRPAAAKAAPSRPVPAEPAPSRPAPEKPAPSRPAPVKAAEKGAARAPARKPAPVSGTREVRPLARGGDPGEAALAGLSSRLAALPSERVVAPRTDVRAAATFVLSTIAERLKDADLVKRLRTLPATELDPALVADLLPAAQAVLHAQTRLAMTEAQQPGPRLPTDLVDQAAALRERMLRVVEYHLSDSAEHEKEIASIKSGQGYADLAEDLNRLATLYRAEGKALREDRRHYQPGDAVAAVQVSHRIQRELRPAEADPKARELAWRTFALLLEIYEEVAAACRYILRKSHGEALFPSLHAVGRSKRRSSGGGDPAPPAGPTS